MPAALLDGTALANQLKTEIAAGVTALRAAGGPQPTLAAIIVGDDPASQVYVKHKRKMCREIGMASRLTVLPGTTTQQELLDLIHQLNNDVAVHGILVQLPLPKQIDARTILEAVRPSKDVDAFHPENVGRIVQGQPRFLPCTPAGIRELLIRNKITTSGKRAVVLGRSDIVGKPMSLLLMQPGPGGDATVTICHSRTRDLPDITREAEILVVAIGRPRFITAQYVRPGAVVVDVGMHRTEVGLVGDCDYESVRQVASHLTPVPGGVGPLTVAMLMQNTLTAAKLLHTGG